jgi:hypothetical protein
MVAIVFYFCIALVAILLHHVMISLFQVYKTITASELQALALIFLLLINFSIPQRYIRQGSAKLQLTA